MVFSTSETHGCKEILNILDFHELQSLVETVTTKKVKVTSKTEAIKAVIMYSESAVQLLRRKKMRRDTLFQYLVSKEVAVAATTDKSGLIRVILQQWGSNIDEQYKRMEDEDDTSPSSQASVASSSSSQTSESNTSQHDRHSSFENRRQQEDYHAQMFPELRHQPMENSVHVKAEIKQKTDFPIDRGVGLVHTDYDTENGTNKKVTAIERNNNEQYLTTPTSVVHSKCDSSLNKPELQILGETFCKWFYENVNSFNPALQQKPADFGPHHFWSDAFLLLSSHTTEISEQRFEGAILTAQRFVAFAKEELLLFNPNISPEGVFVKSDPYGMVMILVCGTIHRDHSCLGIFQQLFAIIKDPRFENNWKIKQTKLNVKTSSVASMPKLDANPEKQMELVPK